MRVQFPSTWLEQQFQSCWQKAPSVGQPCSALRRCQRSISPVLGSGFRPFPVLVAALPTTQGRLHRVSPRNANCFGLCLVQQSHRALRALSQLRDLPDPPSPSPGEPVEVCCGCCSSPHPWAPAELQACTQTGPDLWSQIPGGTRHGALSLGCCSLGVKYPKLSPWQAHCGVRCIPRAGGRVAGQTTGLFPFWRMRMELMLWQKPSALLCCLSSWTPQLLLPTPALSLAIKALCSQAC